MRSLLFPRATGCWTVLAAILFMLVVSGCTDLVAPPDDIGRPFTIYGVLNPTDDVQALRVATFRPEIDADFEREIDATVSSTDLNTGETTAWRDSLVDFGDGRFGHVFSAAFQPVYGRTYRVEVLRSDGQLSSADVTVPPFVKGIALTENGSIIESLWPGPPELNAPQITYIVEDVTCTIREVTVPANLPAEPFEFGWRVRTDLVGNTDAIAAAFAPPGALVLRGVRIGAQVASAGWYPPNGVFDPEVLVDPNAFTNVQNGFGFVGAGYVASVPVSVPDDLGPRYGFRRFQPNC